MNKKVIIIILLIILIFTVKFYYMHYNHLNVDEQYVYSEEVNSTVLSFELPRLSLSYYFIIMILIFFMRMKIN